MNNLWRFKKGEGGFQTRPYGGFQTRPYGAATAAHLALVALPLAAAIAAVVLLALVALPLAAARAAVVLLLYRPPRGGGGEEAGDRRQEIGDRK
jgi:hypothetical protein